MSVDNADLLISAYATYKELYKSKNYRSPYQILAEFIKYVLYAKKMHVFVLTDIYNELISEFGFNLPIAVIKTAIKDISEVTFKDGSYYVGDISNSPLLKNHVEAAHGKCAEIINKISKYAIEKYMDIDEEKLKYECNHFLLDEEVDNKFQKIINTFIIENRCDNEITSVINDIRVGRILYLGLSHNVSEFGSLKNHLTLFLDTEILFDIYGLNGALYQSLATDFLELVHIANEREKIISLKYFSKVKKEIDDFFSRAERFLSGHDTINFTQAMQNVINGCKDVSDIVEKKADFYIKLSKEYRIIEDNKLDYYTSEDDRYNLEGINIREYPSNDDQNYEGYMFCSHINKLRKGNKSNDYLSSKFLCVTETRRVIDISKAIVENDDRFLNGENVCGYAIQLGDITNLLWYKLNRGFNSLMFPKNLDVVIKSQIILSSYVNQNIVSTYKELMSKYKNGELTKDQLGITVLALKEKVLNPEDINTDNVHEYLDFTSEYFDKLKEESAYNKQLIIQRDIIISSLEEKENALKLKLEQQIKINNTLEKEIDSLSSKVRDIEKMSLEKEERKKQFIRRVKCFSFIFVNIIIVSIIIYAMWYVLGPEFPTWIGIILGILGMFPSWKKPFMKKWRQLRYEKK